MAVARLIVSIFMKVHYIAITEDEYCGKSDYERDRQRGGGEREK